MALSGALKTFSIRRRILALAIVLLLAASVILIVFIREYAVRASNQAFDRLLAASALTIAGAVQLEDDAVIVELPFASFAMFSGQDRIFYVVEDPAGRPVTGYAGLADELPETTSADPTFVETIYRGEHLRVASVGRLVSSASATGWVTIRVAETKTERGALAAEILSNAVIPVLAMTLLAVALVWFGIGRMFAPLGDLEAELRTRPPHDLSPVNIPVPTEVSHLVSGLNAFMARLGSTMERLTDLVAEAAHEVRTPLASLRAQAEVAMDEPDPDALRRRVAKIHVGAVQASQLVSQLLMEATISHRLENQEADTTPISAVIDDVLQRLDPDLAGRVSVSITPQAERSQLRGDRLALREMLRNVVDNALTYSDGRVQIGVSLVASTLAITVLDQGPGIPEAEQPLVQQRFKRGANSASTVGSGLGLSIVKRVVEGHGGVLKLRNAEPHGLEVGIALPVVGRSVINKLLQDADQKHSA
ncbi:two-component system, OmpR family, sensor histidine kinase TctE [Devosia sp. YR412]|uniref:sensor histidine kinase n=1 Tax=Devosia sp. YR412 TaxID=1881030 RepID=UPI0008D5290C|nr:sensor histidine kinase [Devosia sp. YR412]SEQ27230.1 two-component system, OmpR family, sensor histidine kinase TctE [Devosia sp. YR412]